MSTLQDNDSPQANEPLYPEKPLSPILSTCKFNRRMIHGRRLNKNKTRTKLSDRFPQEESYNSNIKEVSLCSENTLTEHCRKEQYVGLVPNSANKVAYKQELLTSLKNDFDFKKPISPLSKKQIHRDGTIFNGDFKVNNGNFTSMLKIGTPDCFSNTINTHRSAFSEKSTNTIFENLNFKHSTDSKENYFPEFGEEITKNCNGSIKNTALAGFQSASGKSICISENSIQSVKKVFADENIDGILSKSYYSSVQNCRTDRDVKMSDHAFSCSSTEITDSQMIAAVDDAISTVDIVDDEWTEEDYNNFASRKPYSGVKNTLKNLSEAIRNEQDHGFKGFSEQDVIVSTHFLKLSAVTVNKYSLKRKKGEGCNLTDVITNTKNGPYNLFDSIEPCHKKNKLSEDAKTSSSRQKQNAEQVEENESESESTNSKNSIKNFCRDWCDAKQDSTLDQKQRLLETANDKMLQNLKRSESVGFQSRSENHINRTESNLEKPNISCNDTYTSIKRYRNGKCVNNNKYSVIESLNGSRNSEINNFQGFVTAAGETIKIQPDNLLKASEMLKECLVANKSQYSIISNGKSFENCTEKQFTLDITSDADSQINVCDLNKPWPKLGTECRGQSVLNNNEKVHQAEYESNGSKRNIGNGCNSKQLPKEHSGKSFIVDQNCTNSKISDYSLLETTDCNKMKEDLKFPETLGFKSASGKHVNISENSIAKALMSKKIDSIKPCKDEKCTGDEYNVRNNYFNSSVDLEINNFQEVVIAGGKTENLCNIREVFAEEYLDGASSSSTRDAVLFENSKLSAHDALNKTLLNTTSSSVKCNIDTKKSICDKSKIQRFQGFRKRLGVSHCKQFQISEEKLQRAKLLFEDLEPSKKTESFKDTNPVYSPVKCNYSVLHNSTPPKSSERELNMLKKTLESMFCITSSDITPIKPLKTNRSTYSPSVPNSEDLDHPIVFQQHTKGDINKWEHDLESEHKKLISELHVTSEKILAIKQQKYIIETGDVSHRRPRQGVLHQKKEHSKRETLKNFVCLKEFEVSPEEHTVTEKIMQITPHNALFVHFQYSWDQNDVNGSCIIKTSDGADVIPNTQNKIGLSEIEKSFLCMSGVDPNLLPKGWITNHFKWIIWKLASMERSYPNKFKNCLCVENVIQQLKYRYDREIDRAQRPAVRKILEKDDIPQKRMVLCVADIIKVSFNNFELELTDGWYSIRTIIDIPLCGQVIKSKIVVGAKLITQGAELVNCEGCHPLEMPDTVRLKIFYNCTRRAAWYLKLGYQKYPGPLPVSVQTIHPNGGTVGSICVHIVRVYPVKYMERQGELIVWRNKKAEEKRAQEWENNNIEKMDGIHQQVQEEFEKRQTDPDSANYSGEVISKITCPKKLYDILRKSKDPDKLRENLSESQIADISKYQNYSSCHEQQEMQHRVAEKMKELGLNKRNVTSLLKLLVMDIEGNSEKGTILNIWNPTEDHYQILKEDIAVSVFNVIPRKNGDLSSCLKTHFKPLSITLSPCDKQKRLKRQLLPIAMITEKIVKPLFNEFDTVGIVVQTNVSANDQDVWLTDLVGRLLFIKIVQGPNLCSLLDGISRGHIVATSNLVFCETHQSFGQAIANQCSIMSRYPQQNKLQEAIDLLKRELPKNLSNLLIDCDKKIDEYRTKIDILNNFEQPYQDVSILGSTVMDIQRLDDAIEDSTVIPSCLTTTDIAMSLIDTDQFF